MKTKLVIGAMLLSFAMFSQSNPWLPPFELNHDDDLVSNPITLSASCVHTSPDYSTLYNRYTFYKNNFANHPTVTIPLNFNIWQKDDGTDNWQNNAASIARLYQVVEWMNGHYQNNVSPSDPIAGVVDFPTTKIQFEINQIYFYQNSTMWGSSDVSALSANTYAAHPEAQDIFNIHVTGGYYAGAAGFTTMPSYSLSQEHWIVTFNNEADPAGDWAFAGHLCHEIGHDLDLAHTYGGANCNQSDPDYLSDVHGFGPCPHDAGWSCDPYSTANTCTNNMLGGTAGGYYFSPMQIESMHRALALKSIRRYVKCETYTESFIDILADEVWDFDIKFYNSIKVKAGNTLTIKCKVVMSPNLKIVVEPGARLILDGGKITTECGEYWAGIEVWGNSTQIQNGLTQGSLNLSNGAIIEYANNAVQVWKLNDYTKTGGIVQAVNSTFRNNKNSVSYYPYNNYAPNGNERLNKGRFTNCEFIWDNNFIGTDILPAMKMEHINGVIVTGCDFIDYRTTITNPHQRPIGIFSMDAGYKVLGRNTGPLNSPVHHEYSETNYDVSYFKNLREGIVAFNANTTYAITVDHCKFEDMIYGVHLSSVDNAFITRNKFDFTFAHPSDITVMHEVALSKSTGYTVEGNILNCQPASSNVEGILVYNSGAAPNRIYRNDFNNLYSANYANGQNTNDLSGTNQPSGLQFLCNDYLNSRKYDEYVYTFPNANGNGQGIRLKQGSSLEPAGNTFSVMNPGQGKAHIKSLDYDNIVYYAFNTPNQIPTVLDGGVGIQPIQLSSSACLSTFNSVISVNGGTILNNTSQLQLSSELQTINNTYQVKSSELTTLLSSGNTSSLYNLVAGLNSSNKQNVKNTLLSQSPYLSEELLIALGEKTPSVFPPTWYQAVIEANIEVAQNKTFINYLKTKAIPLPNGLVNQITSYALTHTTERGRKMDQLTDLNTRKTVILDLLIANELSDSNEVNWTNYYSWLVQRNDIICKSQLADMYLGKGEINQCNDKLNDIDIHINEYMVDEIKQEMIDFSSFKKYILGIVNSDGILEGLSNSEILQLEYVANNFTGKASIQARNLLCYYAGMCEDLEVIYETGNKSAETNMTTEEVFVSNLMESLTVIPNPNHGNFKLLVPENCSINKLQIFDVQGKNVEYETLENKGNEMIINIQGTNSGIYILKANCSDEVTLVSRILIK